VKVTRSEVRPWDPEVQKRVVEDMADGKPSKALQLPTLLTRRVPKYPTKARKAGVAGTVRVEAKIGLNGKAERFTVVDGHPELVEAVKTAVAQWRFKPIKVDGKPHEMKAFVDVAFTLR
jgi:protein TonB